MVELRERLEIQSWATLDRQPRKVYMDEVWKAGQWVLYSGKELASSPYFSFPEITT